MIKQFIIGNRYRCLLTERPNYFNNEGDMDEVLDGQPHECTVVTGTVHGGEQVAQLEGCSGIRWIWHLKDFEEVVDNWKKRLKK